MPHDMIPDIFDVQVYGDVKPINQTLSKARCRIFYKYENRNGGYITDEFAEKLISTIPYAPVKGIYDGEKGDFVDHGYARTEGRIYGVVMAEPNFAWEQHEDKDGAMRTYACVDVLLFTGLYPQAKLIPGKPQSMELYPPSIKGEWKNMGGPYDYYVYEDACFLGLQALGDDVEPCFEGASFFSLLGSVNELVEELKKFNLASQQNEGGTNMDLENSTVGGVTDSSEDEALKKAAEEADKAIDVEPEDEEVKEDVEDTSDDSAADDETEESEEEKDDDAEVEPEDDADSKDDEDVEVEDEDDKEEPESDDDEDSDENFSALEQKIAEQENTIATLTSEKENYEARIQELESEISSLKDFKLEVETLKKNEILESYVEFLSEDILKGYADKLDTYTDLESLDKDLAYEMKKSNSAVFSKSAEPATGFVPAGDPEVTGISAILEKYSKK